MDGSRSTTALTQFCTIKTDTKRSFADLSEKAPEHLKARAEHPIKNPKECRGKRAHHENHTCRQQNFAARWPRHF